MGWDGDDIMLRRVPKLLGPLYAGCIWSIATSLSPVVVRHRKGMTEEQRTTIVEMFPKDIRVEFQETESKVNTSRVYGFGFDNRETVIAFWESGTGAEDVKSAMISAGLGEMPTKGDS